MKGLLYMKLFKTKLDVATTFIGILIVLLVIYSFSVDDSAISNQYFSVCSGALGVAYSLRAYSFYRIKDNKNAIFYIVIGIIWFVLALLRIL